MFKKSELSGIADEGIPILIFLVSRKDDASTIFLISKALVL